MRITMRSNKTLLDRFDYLSELIGEGQTRSNLLSSACQITLDRLNRNRDTLSQAQRLKVKSYIRDSMPENIKIDIEDELYGVVREEIKNYFSLEKLQNPFVCKLVLSVYIMSLEGRIGESKDVSNDIEEMSIGESDMGLFTSDFERIDILMQMLKKDRKYVDEIDGFLRKWKKEVDIKGED